MMLKIATLAFALAAVVAPASAQEAKSPIIGAWRMTELQFGSAGAMQTVPYGGQVIFSEGGTLSVQAMNPDTAAADTPYTTNGYEAYYGPVVIDEAEKSFTITVESSLVRKLIGQSLKRRWDVSGDTLTLTPDNPAEGWRVTYKRF